MIPRAYENPGRVTAPVCAVPSAIDLGRGRRLWSAALIGPAEPRLRKAPSHSTLDPRMQLSVSGKHIDVGDSLRGHVAETLGQSVDRFFGGAIEGKVTFARERHLFRADIVVHVARGVTAVSHGEAADPYAAFDAAVSRLDTRLQRYKGRLTDRHRQVMADAPEALPAQYFVLSPEPPDTAEDRNHGKPAIVAELATEVMTLTAGDAAMHLDLANHQAMMFRNSAHGGLNVVYRRADGAIGWIDPGPPAELGGARKKAAR
jgi:ribosomal subunit interface protein